MSFYSKGERERKKKRFSFCSKPFETNCDKPKLFMTYATAKKDGIWKDLLKSRWQTLKIVFFIWICKICKAPYFLLPTIRTHLEQKWIINGHIAFNSLLQKYFENAKRIFKKSLSKILKSNQKVLYWIWTFLELFIYGNQSFELWNQIKLFFQQLLNSNFNWFIQNKTKLRKCLSSFSFSIRVSKTKIKMIR